MKTLLPLNNRNKTVTLAALTALTLAVPESLLLAQGAPSTGSSQGNQQGGPGHPHGGPHLLPPHAAETLDLTVEQKQQLKELEAEVKSKIESILTSAQMEQLKQMRPQHPPRRGGEVPQVEAPDSGNQSPSTNQPTS